MNRDADPASTKLMINSIVSSGVHAADVAALRQNRAKKTEPGQDTTVQTGKTEKSAHPAHPHGHVPPGLARAAERIASKIFSRADADASGTITQQELSAVHSRHARVLASSDLFKTTTQTTSNEPPVSQSPPDTSNTITTETGIDTSDTETNPAFETTTETPPQPGITEAQLKEALTKFFYAKVGVTYASPAPPSTGQPEPTAQTNLPPSDPISSESASNQTLPAVA